jgi:hypothetical protein
MGCLDPLEPKNHGILCFMKNVHNLFLIVNLSSHTLEFQNLWEMDLKMKYYSNQMTFGL